MSLIDLSGQRFGRLTVLYRDIEEEKKKKDRSAIWKCKCDCGNFKSVVGKDLRLEKLNLADAYKRKELVK